MRDEYHNLICWHIKFFWIMAGNKNVIQWFHSSFPILRTYWIRVLKQKKKMRVSKILTAICQTLKLKIKFDPKHIVFFIVLSKQKRIFLYLYFFLILHSINPPYHWIFFSTLNHNFMIVDARCIFRLNFYCTLHYSWFITL